MANEISDIVNVSITRETATVSEQGFGIAMILGVHKKWNDRIKYYASLDEMVTDGFSSTEQEYLAASKIFAQSPHPTQIAVGRRSVDTVGVTVSTVDDEALYTITIDGTDCEYQAQENDTGSDIAVGLRDAINGESLGVTASANSSVVTIVADVANVAYTLTVGTGLTIGTLTASDSIGDDLTAVNVANDNWYALVITTRTQQTVEDAAAWIEASSKIFGTASADANILSSGSTSDIAYVLNDAGYTRTFVVYHADAATVYPEAAWIGALLPKDPGSENWAFKSLNGISASNLTTNQRANAYAKKANSYETRNGLNVTRQGTMASGEYIDVIIGIDWLVAELAGEIFLQLANSPKIPFTDAGIAAVESKIKFVLQKSVSRQVLTTPYVVVVPKAADVSAQDKAARSLTGVTFTAPLAGAINSVSIQGTVTV